MPALPTGTVTFLFTDVEGSTRLWEQYPGPMGRALARHDVLIEGIVDDHGGALVRPRGEGVSGIAVHTGARVMAQAGAGEVLVSSTVRDLVAGSGLQFADRGVHSFQGVPGEWRLFAVV